MAHKSLNKLSSLMLLLSISLSVDAIALKWAGCGITKKAFMAELATAYEKQSGIKIELDGGGATKGIQQVISRSADLGPVNTN
ncbi:MAG: hypothetical protein AAES65_02710 [Candidatus Thiodiazotropha sp. (ex. Lucinoma kazani)]